MGGLRDFDSLALAPVTALSLIFAVVTASFLILPVRIELALI